jgi:hypothetical protein
LQDVSRQKLIPLSASSWKVFLRTPQAPCIFEYISSTNSWEIACQALISRKSRHVSPFEEFTHRTPPQEHDSAPKGKIDNYVVKQWEAKKVQAHLGVSRPQRPDQRDARFGTS